MTKSRLLRAIAAFVLALTAGGAGYTLGGAGGIGEVASIAIPAQTVSAPPADSIRVIYSLDGKRNDKEIIALIDSAKKYVYFAIYTFTLRDIADALIAAKKRGVEVRGLIDSEQGANSYGAPIVKMLTDAGISVVNEKHATGSGIMHIKALVTESAYATGSYNWTKSATTINDEILEVGTDPGLRQAYENILKKLLGTYRNNPALSGERADFISAGTIDYTEAPAHVGERASVRGKLLRTYTSASGTVFLDFCANYKTCPFSGVIFADDAEKFGDLSRYEGSSVTLSGKISLYEGRAEIILSSPDQLSF